MIEKKIRNWKRWEREREREREMKSILKRGNQGETRGQTHGIDKGNSNMDEELKGETKRQHETPLGQHDTPKGQHETPKRQHETPQRQHETPSDKVKDKEKESERENGGEGNVIPKKRGVRVELNKIRQELMGSPSSIDKTKLTKTNWQV